MKRLTILVLLAFSFVTTYSQAVGDSLQLMEPAFNFGKIPQGKPVFHDFQVRNKGKDSLTISNVQASCGCTTPEWDHSPIPPGEKAIIKVGYNAATEGAFSKSVSINANGQEKIIVISGNVFKAPATSGPLNASVTLLKNSN
ncbi:MAG TPA: DUF1573 domain-containing protein [Flavitalea sp.]|nr:DUF1573 domain-containing protein [Flavitalea sp.]